MISRPKLKDYIETCLVDILEERLSVNVTPSYNVQIKIASKEGIPTIDLDLDLLVQILDRLRYIRNTLNLHFYFDMTGQNYPFIHLIVNANVIRFRVVDK